MHSGNDGSMFAGAVVDMGAGAVVVMGAGAVVVMGAGAVVGSSFRNVSIFLIRDITRVALFARRLFPVRPRLRWNQDGSFPPSSKEHLSATRHRALLLERRKRPVHRLQADSNE